MSDRDDIQRSLGRIEGVLGEIKSALDRGAHRMDGHDKRLRKVENRQHWYSGIGAAAGVVLGMFGHKAGF